MPRFQTGIKLVDITLAPLAAGGAYALGDVLGSAAIRLTTKPLDQENRGTLFSYMFTDTANQAASIDLMFFNRKLATALVDNAALPSFTAAEVATIVGVVRVAFAAVTNRPYSYSCGMNGVTAMNELALRGCPVTTTSGEAQGDLWVVPYVAVGTPTYTNSCISGKLGLSYPL
jgi:hypothetical protein